VETIGSLVDKLCITRLKNHYADTDSKKESTTKQIKLLEQEINGYMAAALRGEIEELTFAQNKVYKQWATQTMKWDLAN
jgi:hypothetical protein